MSSFNYKAKTKRAMWMDAFPQKPKIPKKPNLRKPAKRIRSVSKSRAAVTRLYRSEAKQFITEAFLKGAVCPVLRAVMRGEIQANELAVGCHPISEVHHMRGRLGALLLDKRYWVGVSRSGHAWIHANPKSARKIGLICQPGKWNNEK